MTDAVKALVERLAFHGCVPYPCGRKHCTSCEDRAALTGLVGRNKRLERELARQEEILATMCRGVDEVTARLAAAEESDARKTREVTLLVDENREQAARLAAAEAVVKPAQAVMKLWTMFELAPHHSADGDAIGDAFEQLRATLPLDQDAESP